MLGSLWLSVESLGGVRMKWANDDARPRICDPRNLAASLCSANGNSRTRMQSINTRSDNILRFGYVFLAIWLVVVVVIGEAGERSW